MTTNGNTVDAVVVSPEVVKQEVALVEASVPELEAKYRNFTIENDETYVVVGDDLVALKERKKQIADVKKKFSTPLRRLATQFDSFFEVAEKRIDALILRLGGNGGLMIQYQNKRDAALREEQAREAAAAAAEQAKIARRIETQAVKAENVGDDVTAQLLRASVPASIPIVTSLPAEAPKVAGLRTKVGFAFTVVNKRELIEAVALGLVPDSVLAVDDKALQKIVDGAGLALKFPGVVVTETSEIKGTRR